ncbi:hypothetical protein IPZ58_16185 [Streptomyces roseoverticillatus]|uniref:hypothetical protein n=1 Tax=Streptomyces roseoverticillatus TaxID=66429 RepID=UPI001F20A9AB|nr:hypothetical protein [Streptomyces roseoverticillatus]MCF3103112.1 hypothetical protein [Streptomyces roseoverticillatus]
MPRIRRRSFATAAVSLGVCAAAVAGVTTAGGSAAAETKDEPSVVGSGKLKRNAGDDVHFAIDAHGFADKARGSFDVSHQYGKEFDVRFKGRIDCLLTGGPVAVATGIVTDAQVKVAPGVPMPSAAELKGKRFGFTILDGGKGGKKDRLGYSWAMDGLPVNSVGKCVSSAPFETLEKGDFTTHHWMPSRNGA